MKCPKVLALMAIAGLTGFAVFAAPPKTDQTTNKNQAGESGTRSAEYRTHWRNADHQLASCVALENQEEIAIARFAQKKLNDKDAKDFAQMLVDDHSKFLKKLEQYAPEATEEGFLREQPATRERAAVGGQNPQVKINRERTLPGGRKVESTTTIERTAAKPNLDQQEGQLPIDFLQLHREMAEQCLAESEDLLNEKSGKKFDECFIGMQIDRHTAMKAKLEVFQRHASGDFKDLLDQGLKTTEHHLDRAKKIMEQLADSSEKSTKND